MERYHMSESIRIGGLGIGGITRRRSLSFSNVSGVGISTPVRSNTRGAHDYGNNSNYPRYGGQQSSRRPDGHPLDYRRPDLHLSYDKEGSGLKKFLNRTKSLIWKRQATDRFDSISVAGSTGSLELWGSHASLIETNYDVFEMKELGSSKNNINNHYDDDVTIKDENIREIEEPVKGKGSGKQQQQEHQQRREKSRSSSKGPNVNKNVPPPLPPFPANLRALHGLNVKPSANTGNNKATSTTESLHNVSLPGSPEPIDNDGIDGSTIIGARDSDSCIFISDHMKCKGSQRSGHKSTKSSIITERHSKKIQANLMDDDEEEPTHDTLPKKGHRSKHQHHHNHHHHPQQVTRVESFSGSEAPIVPVQSGKNGKKKSSSGPLQAQQQNGMKGSNGPSANAIRPNGSSVNGTDGRSKGHISRSFIAQEHSRKFSYNSDEEEVDVDDYGVDEDVIDFDDEDNDHYGDSVAEVDNVSSVFMEPEPEQEEIEALATEMKAPQSLPPMSTPTASIRSSSQPARTSKSHHHHHHPDFPNGFSTGKSRDSSAGHYDHSGRFAPIVAYNGSSNGKANHNHNGSNTLNGKSGRMSSPAPPPPPPSAPATMPSKSSSRRSQTDKASSHGSHRKIEKQRSAGGSSSRGGGSRPTTIKGSIRSEFHTVELIATTDSSSGKVRHNGRGNNGEKPIFDYGSQIHRRLYCPERNSRMDQKSERSGNLCGPWYDLWADDQPGISCK